MKAAQHTVNVLASTTTTHRSSVTESHHIGSHVSGHRTHGHMIKLLCCSYTLFLCPERPFSISGSQPISDQIAMDRFL